MISILLPAALAGNLLALVTGPLGAFVIWRRMAYFGDALTHAALLGNVLGLLLHLDPYICIISLCVLLTLSLTRLENRQQFAMDTLLGVLAHACLALGLILISTVNHLRMNVFNYLCGDLLAVTWHDLYWIGSSVVLVMLFLAYNWRRLIALTVSGELAQVDGINVKLTQLSLRLVTSLIIGLSMKFVGALLTTSLLIIPAASARHWARTPEEMAGYATLFGMLSINGGLLLSWHYDTPTGPSVVLTATVFFLLGLFKKQIISKNYNMK